MTFKITKMAEISIFYMNRLLIVGLMAKNVLIQNIKYKINYKNILNNDRLV